MLRDSHLAGLELDTDWLMIFDRPSDQRAFCSDLVYRLGWREMGGALSIFAHNGHLDRDGL
ncbi:hypothetical protein [Thiocapsa sp.]|uniref:hypothetical protein n=1 Tax=Thiocapsa sp. TaxID=2024551 RepID=UPI003592FC71